MECSSGKFDPYGLSGLASEREETQFDQMLGPISGGFMPSQDYTLIQKTLVQGYTNEKGQLEKIKVTTTYEYYDSTKSNGSSGIATIELNYGFNEKKNAFGYF